MSDQIFRRLAAGGVHRQGKTVADGGYHLGQGVIEGFAELVAVRRLP